MYKFDECSLDAIDKKLLFDCLDEISLDAKAVGNKSPAHRNLISLIISTEVRADSIRNLRPRSLERPKLMSKTFISSDPSELCKRLQVLLLYKETKNFLKNVTKIFLP